MSGFVLLRDVRRDEQQRVIELDALVTEFKSLEIFATLPKGSAKEITAGRTLSPQATGSPATSCPFVGCS
jgi:hypothetical protein